MLDFPVCSLLCNSKSKLLGNESRRGLVNPFSAEKLVGKLSLTLRKVSSRTEFCTPSPRVRTAANHLWRDLSNTQRVSKPMGFKIASSGHCQNSQVWRTSNFGTRLGWFFGTQKAIKSDGFQSGKFWGLSKLAILVPLGGQQLHKDRDKKHPENMQKTRRKHPPTTLNLPLLLVFSVRLSLSPLWASPLDPSNLLLQTASEEIFTKRSARK